MAVENTELEGSLGLTAYRVLFEHAPEGVVFSTLDGSLYAANPAACALLAMSEDEMQRWGRAALIDPDHPRLGPWLDERFRTGTAKGVIRLRRGDDRKIDLEVESRLFRDTDGTVLSFSVLHDVTAQTETQRTLAELSARLDQVALTDHLTGLANRRGLIVAGTELFARADRDGVPIEVLYVNVHNMAELNGWAGRRAGDAVLVAVARAVRGAVGPDDVVTRVAPTGFLALAYGLETSARPAAVRWVEEQLDSSETLTQLGIQTTVSFGWVRRQPGSAVSLEAYIARADRATCLETTARRVPAQPD